MIKIIKRLTAYFTIGEIILYIASVGVIVISYLLCGSDSTLTLFASIIGATMLILNAKGNPIGQVFAIIFSILYGIISYSFSYYGEMITYLGMTGPMALLALISWIRNPYNGNHAQVEVNKVGGREFVFMTFLTLAVTVVFYFILDFFNTANIIPSTISVTTSFAAVYLTFRRSKYYALAYAANDLVLIVLWVLASLSDKSYLSVVVCFVMFTVNDLYGFISWHKMSIAQTKTNRNA